MNHAPDRMVRYEVEIRPNGGITVTPKQQAPEPWTEGMASEIATAIESALQGCQIGAYELDEDGGWFKLAGDDAGNRHAAQAIENQELSPEEFRKENMRRSREGLLKAVREGAFKTSQDPR